MFLCIVFQIISGIWLVFSKGFVRQPFYVIIQVMSGLYLSFFMVYHVRAVLLGRYQWKVPTDFYFAAGVANRYPEKLFFIPYYTLSLVSVFAHIACVHYIKRMEQAPGCPEACRRRYRNETIGICIAGAAITFLIMIALTGMLFPISL